MSESVQVSDSFSNLSLPYPIKNIRNWYFNGNISLDLACSLIDNKRDFSSYVVYSYIGDHNIKNYVMSKCSFRGNDVYRARVWNRHLELLRFCELNKDKNYIIKNKDGGFSSSILKFTLTVDPKHYSRDDFNSSKCSYFYDIFIKRLRNNFPNVVVARSYEVSTKKARGYLHINVIAVFTDHSFPVYLHKSKKHINSKGKPIESWRLVDYSEKKNLSSFWNCGFVDIRAVKDSNDLAEYSLKYHIKNFTNKSNKSNQDLTMSVLSLYNKRAFSFPRVSSVRGTADFTETVINYTVGLDNNDSVLFPRLDIINHNSLNYKFEGFFYDYYNDYNPKVWYKELKEPPPEVNCLYPFEDISFNPFIVNLCSFDSGSRLDDKLIKSVFVNPKFTKQKTLQNR